MKHFLLAVILAALTGCASTKPEPEVRYVTREAEKVVLPAEPAWVSKDLPKGTPVNEVATKILADLQAALGYIDELKAKFKPYIMETSK
jgi:hypothetical protein